MGKTSRKVKRNNKRGSNSPLLDQKITRLNRSCYSQAMDIANSLADGKEVTQDSLNNFRETRTALAGLVIRKQSSNKS